VLGGQGLQLLEVGHVIFGVANGLHVDGL
jgi:hypothetical protein